MDPISAIANGVSVVFNEVGSWFTTSQEQQQFDLQGQSLDTQLAISNNDLAIASLDEVFTDGEQEELLFYAGVAIVLIIIIAIVIAILK